MAHSTPIFILSLLLLATISNACNTCILPAPPPPPPTPPPCPSTPVEPAAPPPAACPRDTLKLGTCMDLLGGIIGTPPSSSCCALLEGLADMEVAMCLCTAIKANVLGIIWNIPIALSTIVSACGKSVPPGFKCE